MYFFTTQMDFIICLLQSIQINQQEVLDITFIDFYFLTMETILCSSYSKGCIEVCVQRVSFQSKQQQLRHFTV